jgi:hypothetical protein
MDLFAAPGAGAGNPASTALDATVDLIRERFGNLAVRRGSALPEARGMDESDENMSEKAPESLRRRGHAPTDRH